MNTSNIKLDDLQKYIADRTYAAAATELYEAIKHNDPDQIAFFNQFGTKLRMIVINYNTYLARRKFGFDEIILNEYGWMPGQPEWLNINQLDILLNNKKCSNSVTVGMGLNRKWAFGYNYSTGNGGGCCGINEYHDVYDSEKDALLAGLQLLLTFHKKAKESHFKYGDSCHNYQEAFSSSVVKQIEKEIGNLTAPQLSLF